MAVVWQRQEDGVLYQVHRRGDRMRLFANGVQHSEFHPKRLVTGSVWDLLWLPALLSEPQRFRRVLILGLGGGTTELEAPEHKDPGNSKNFPQDPSLFQTHVYPLLDEHCSDCHQSDANTPQGPYLAADDVNEAYTAARSKMDLNSPELSRLVERLGDPLRDASPKCYPQN